MNQPMNLPTREDLNELMSFNNEHSASIYMPTFRVGDKTLQNPIRFKNLVTELEKQMEKAGLESDEIASYLNPAKELQDTYSFWQYQSDGFALFMNRDYFRYFRVPMEFKELAVLTNRFHLKPLLPLFAGDGKFYVLAISQNNVRLFRGSRHSVDQINLEDLPNSLADALGVDEAQTQLQFHSGSTHKGGEGGGLFASHGTGEEDNKEKIQKYFHLIDDGLRGYLGGDNAPLVLAGVDYYFPLYREVNSYPYLTEGMVAGNPEYVSIQELHQRAWEIVRPIFDKDKNRALEQYGNFHGTGKATNDLNTIIPAASQGRVDTLFVAVGEQVWGDFIENDQSLRLTERGENGSQDLLDLAAIQTLTNGGKVFAEKRDRIPDQSSLAAIFRY
ncbi:hypothetical protein K8I28_00365 [bacterium]|nr:hypothetical protein [bacterium]